MAVSLVVLSLVIRMIVDLDVSMNPVPDQGPSSVVAASLIMRVTVDVSVSIDVA